MDNIPINLFDLGVIIVLLGSALFAFARGFVKEALSILSWIGAAFAALYLLPHVAPAVRAQIQPDELADMIAGIGLFIVVLVILHIISAMIARSVQSSGLSALDRTLGFIFGLVRGALLVCAGWILIVSLWPRENHPPWITEARTLPLVERGAAQLWALVPDSLRDKSGDLFDSAAAFGEDGDDLFKRFMTQGGAANGPDSDDETGYKERNRRQLKRLIEDQETD